MNNYIAKNCPSPAGNFPVATTSLRRYRNSDGETSSPENSPPRKYARRLFADAEESNRLSGSMKRKNREEEDQSSFFSQTDENQFPLREIFENNFSDLSRPAKKVKGHGGVQIPLFALALESPPLSPSPVVSPDPSDSEEDSDSEESSESGSDSDMSLFSRPESPVFALRENLLSKDLHLVAPLHTRNEFSRAHYREEDGTEDSDMNRQEKDKAADILFGTLRTFVKDSKFTTSLSLTSLFLESHCDSQEFLFILDKSRKISLYFKDKPPALKAFGITSEYQPAAIYYDIFNDKVPESKREYGLSHSFLADFEHIYAAGHVVLAFDKTSRIFSIKSIDGESKCYGRSAPAAILQALEAMKQQLEFMEMADTHIEVGW